MVCTTDMAGINVYYATFESVANENTNEAMLPMEYIVVGGLGVVAIAGIAGY